MTSQMTEEQVRRIHSAIAECDRYIAKEGSRDPELRPAWAQKALDHAISHKIKLQRALETRSMSELRFQS